MPVEQLIAPASATGATDQTALTVLASCMTDGVVILDAGARVSYCNAAFARILGSADEDVTGTSIVDHLDPVDRQAFLTSWRQRSLGYCEPYKGTWLRSDGGRVATDILPWPIFNAAGVFNGSVTVVIDVAERQRIDTEAAIATAIGRRSSSVLYRARVESEITLEYMSPNCIHLGHCREAVARGDVRLADVVHERDYERILAELNWHIAQGHREFLQTYRVRTAGGALRWVDDHVYLREMFDGAGLYREGIVTDVTQRHDAAAVQRQTCRQAIDAFTSAMQQQAPATAGHQRRVADLSRAIARKLGLSEDQEEGTYLGALMHAVGMLVVPLEPLEAAGEPAGQELARASARITAGVRVVSHIAFPWPSRDVVAQHKERLDGSGYPAGLSGSEIGVEARIVAVADAFESMTTQRPGRAALSADAALARLSDGSTVLFDANVVEACHQLVLARGGDLSAFWRAMNTLPVREASASQDDGRVSSPRREVRVVD
jgi:PAS domain S-box-containing protein